MAERHKTPEELGAAVGKKIDELFGGLFGDEPETKPAARPADSSTESIELQPEMTTPISQSEWPTESPKKPTPPPAKSAVPSPAEAPQPASAPAGEAKNTPEWYLERIEVLTLDLEWEMSQDTVRELSQKFKALTAMLPNQPAIRPVMDMTMRVLGRFGGEGVSPHPLLVSLLQETVTVAKQSLANQGRKPPDKAILSSIASKYKQITAAGGPPPRTQKVAAPQAVSVGQLAGNIGEAVASLEEVTQRLTKMVAAWKKGAQMQPQDVARRLGTLASVLTDRLGQLHSSQRALSKLDPNTQGAVDSEPSEDNKEGPDGVLMVAWSGLPLAIPSSLIMALYPLSKQQATQFANKQTISLGNRQVSRLPLSRPKGADQKPQVTPTWLLHVSIGGREYFLLADRTLGFRGAPKGVDLNRQPRLKIGATNYTILNQASFR